MCGPGVARNIALANDLDRACDIDRRVMVPASLRNALANLRLLYRGDVDRIRVEGPGSPERGANQGTMRLLRKVLAGSRYQIVNYRTPEIRANRRRDNGVGVIRGIM